ncbi:putative pectinesterase/pectinesterase inhibitor 46 [Vitis vinifera]|uniref:Pectinesterase n=1 Tax=Vitis vinifera TaxID=29760 RepID=A0A438EBD8_VITVI|nr:putative pectinesterase/pectinesterase inhibitor 46 [Vitis vinifera]
MLPMSSFKAYGKSMKPNKRGSWLWLLFVGTTTNSGGKSKNAGNSVSTSIKAMSCTELFSASPSMKASRASLTKCWPGALDDCYELLDLAIDNLNSSLSSSLDNFDDLKTWLSAAGTYQETCINGFESGNLRSSVLEFLKNSTEFSSNSLAIITEISKLSGSISSRRLMGLPEDKVPKWLSAKDRKLLQSSSTLKKKADAVVATDGSGKYKTISEALKAVPDKSKKSFVIYVKKGVYNENVRVEKSKWNVLMIGDGMNKTVVSGKLNFVDGTPTFSTATFAVFGKGFVAREMGFRNTAGAIKHQAVALMSSADQTVFYRCLIDAFQDSLYAHSHRQFYRECDIYGTVDFIFGNSAVVFQNCNILPKQPMPGQQNTITAQGKNDPNQNTGIAIQNCTILTVSRLELCQDLPWTALEELLNNCIHAFNDGELD